jgi:endonuclease/exonuclease/phosphatase family metal-dependent hydrolase
MVPNNARGGRLAALLGLCVVAVFVWSLRGSRRPADTRQFILGVFLAAFVSIVVVPAARAEAPQRCVSRPVMHGGIDATAHPPVINAVTVASLNIAGQARIADALATWAHDRSVDVLLLQEVGHASGDGGTFVAALSARLGAGFTYAPADRVGNGHTQGLAIVSRYPLRDVRVDRLDYFRLRFRSRCRIALAATVETPAGPLRVVNVHLDTRINSRNRVAQLAPALDALRIVDGPRIIGGDFNTINIGWFRTMWPLPYVQRQSAAVRALLSSAGFHTPFTGSPPTFRVLGLPLRLDWLYVTDLEALDWGVDRVRFTDHRGVWVRVTPGEPRIPQRQDPERP